LALENMGLGGEDDSSLSRPKALPTPTSPSS